MKIIKLLFVLVVVSALTFSCKSEKKDAAADDAAVEMTEEGSMDENASDASSDASASDGDGSSAAGAAAGAAAAGAASGDASAAPAEGVDASSKGLEEMVVAEGVNAEEVADTPAIYPGCVGNSREAVTACNKTKFIEFIEKEFNKDIANGLGLGPGLVEIHTIVQVSTEGKCSAIKVTTPHFKLENEMKRVIAAVPQVTPASHEGEAVPVTFKLPFSLEIKQDLIEK